MRLIQQEKNRHTIGVNGGIQNEINNTLSKNHGIYSLNRNTSNRDQKCEGSQDNDTDDSDFSTDTKKAIHLLVIQMKMSQSLTGGK